jgi:hypothetical protein
VGHVDESYQFLPASLEASNGCGYVLAYTDYLDGIRLGIGSTSDTAYGSMDLISDKDGDGRNNAKDRLVTRKEYIESLKYFTGVTLPENADLDFYHKVLLEKFKFEKRPRAFPNFLGFRKEDVYIYKAFQAQKSILSGVATLVKHVSQEGCQKLVAKALPSLWSFSINENPSGDWDELKGSFISNLTAFTNFVVLNDFILIPDSKAPSQIYTFFHDDREFSKLGEKFKFIINERLKALGHFKSENVFYVDMASAIFGDGAAHCKVNVLRSEYK